MNSERTYFASPERSSHQNVLDQQQLLLDYHSTVQLLDSIAQPIMILNGNRQIALCNRALMAMLLVKNRDDILGKRPGEVVGCVNAFLEAGGCGTAEACRNCGAVLAILESLQGEESYRECLLNVESQGKSDSLELGINATALHVQNQVFSILTISNLSHEKRRQNLERIFFHDIINTAGSLQSYVELLVDNLSESNTISSGGPFSTRQMLNSLQQASRQLTEEILEQRDLLMAETDQLEVRREYCASLELLSGVVGQYLGNRLAKDIAINIDTSSENITFNSSGLLIRRVLGNMLKNALEASAPGQVVDVGCRRSSDGTQIDFWVRNQTVMPRDIQLKLFQRSFSTKGRDRGLGTYSMKLLTERYLGGTVRFEVCQREGTTFIASYPL